MNACCLFFRIENKSSYERLQIKEEFIMKKVVEWIAIILLIMACFVCNPWPAQDSHWTAHDEGKEYAWFDQDGHYHYRWTVYWLSTETGTPEQVIAEHFEGA